MKEVLSSQQWIRGRGKAVDCPYCGSSKTRREAVFGSFHMSETYFCGSCGSPFSRIKWEEAPGTKSGG